ncbi:MAG: glycosyltransferase, partial [Phycisphaerales bacterium]|nr:glycosyltransferase [Phycisphaerales bacterium]
PACGGGVGRGSASPTEGAAEQPAASKPLPSSFWLAVGALEPYKRGDLAIAAARLARKPIVIAGTGSEEPTLRRLAASDAIFLGRVGDEQLRGLYRASELLVFPQIEDFGITAVEAQACGCPVLARAAGGALDTVIDGVTGGLFDWSGADTTNLHDAIARVPQRSPGTTAACRASAERFSEQRFTAGLLAAIDARPRRTS